MKKKRKKETLRTVQLNFVIQNCFLPALYQEVWGSGNLGNAEKNNANREAKFCSQYEKYVNTPKMKFMISSVYFIH